MPLVDILTFGHIFLNSESDTRWHMHELLCFMEGLFVNVLFTRVNVTVCRYYCCVSCMFLHGSDLVVSTSASDWLERHGCNVVCYEFMWTLNPTHSLTHHV